MKARPLGLVIALALAASNGVARADVRAVEAEVAKLEASKRGLVAPIGPLLRRLGKTALIPMLARLSAGRGALTETGWKSFRLGLIEALGALRDARTAATMRAVLASDERDPDVLRAAAQALGKLGSDRVVADLGAMVGDPRLDLAAVAGLGQTHRRAAAHLLADEIAAHPSAARALALGDALGDVGNAWAFRTPGIAQPEEEAEAREITAKALFSAVLAYEGDVRARLLTALMVVAWKDTGDLIANARGGASDETNRVLDQVAERLGRTSVH